MDDLLELKDELVNCKDANELISLCWEKSTKNMVACGYIAGMVDALYWAGKLTQQEYTDWHYKLHIP